MMLVNVMRYSLWHLLTSCVRREGLLMRLRVTKGLGMRGEHRLDGARIETGSKRSELPIETRSN